MINRFCSLYVGSFIGRIVAGMSVSTRLSMLISIIVLFSSSAAMTEDGDYYRAEIAVKSQGKSERSRAAIEGLMEVLYRITGTEAAFESEYVLNRLEKALSYVEQFQFRALDDADMRAQGYQEYMRMRFSELVIENLIADAGLGLWPISRPNTLVWLVEDHPEFGRQTFNEFSEHALITQLAQTALIRGLPLNYPLLDLEDQLNLSANDVWDFNEQAIKEASQRYEADAILVGRVTTLSNGELWSSWQFYHAGTTRQYDVRAESPLVDVGRQALMPLADFLANKYAFVPEVQTSPSLMMYLSGVTDFAAYYKALAYLEDLALVNSVSLLEVRQDVLSLSVGTESSLELLLRTFKLDKKIAVQKATNEQPVWEQARRGTRENPLRFYWLGR